MFYVFIAIVFVLLLNVLCAYFMKKSAAMKGYGEDSHIWAICFWGGLFGTLYVISLPDLSAREQREDILNVLLSIQCQENK